MTYAPLGNLGAASTSGLTDADFSRWASIAQFSYKPDGGSMWGDFVIASPPDQLLRVTGNVVPEAQRAALQKALDAERARGYYFEDDIVRLLGEKAAAAAAGQPTTAAGSSQSSYDAARAKAIADAAAHPYVPPPPASPAYPAGWQPQTFQGQEGYWGPDVFFYPRSQFGDTPWRSYVPGTGVRGPSTPGSAVVRPPSGWRYNGSNGWWGPDGLFYVGSASSAPWSDGSVGVSVTTFAQPTNAAPASGTPGSTAPGNPTNTTGDQSSAPVQVAPMPIDGSITDAGGMVPPSQAPELSAGFAGLSTTTAVIAGLGLLGALWYASRHKR